MNTLNNKPGKGRTGWIELVTGRIGKITALFAAIALALTQVGKLPETFQDTLRRFGVISPPGPCVEVKANDVVFPSTVKYSEWDNMRIRLKGINNCKRQLGLYVTFMRRRTEAPNFILRVPYEGSEGCTGKEPLQEPRCWDWQKPVATTGKREWEWETRPPPLSRLNDSHSTETIVVKWEVRDLDEPTKPPIAADSAPIKITYDTGP